MMRVFLRDYCGVSGSMGCGEIILWVFKKKKEKIIQVLIQRGGEITGRVG